MTAKPRMGRIEFLNVLPVYHAMEAGYVPHNFDLAYGPPSSLNAMIQRNELAVSSVSCIEYARRPENYRILPDLSISSRGKVQSVLLLSRVPVNLLAGRSVHVSTATHTSAVLLKVLLEEYAGIYVSYISGDISKDLLDGSHADAILVIGDEALRERHRSDYPYTWDLGEQWFHWTGLPFVFGLWVARKDAVFEQDPVQVLHASRAWGMNHMDRCISVAMQNSPMGKQALEEYFTCLQYSLGDQEIEGLLLFYRLLAQKGEIDRAPDLCFWK